MMVTQLAQLIYFLVKTNQIIVNFRLTTINTVTAENQFNALAWSCAGATGACAEDSEQENKTVTLSVGGISPYAQAQLILRMRVQYPTLPQTFLVAKYKWTK